MTATEVKKAELKPTWIKPKFDDIVQDSLRELTAPADALCNGTVLRLPAGVIVAVTSGGSHGQDGRLLRKIEMIALNGERYVTPAGTQVTFPKI